MLNGKNVLITGGTGTLGRALTKEIINRFPKVNKLVVFSRDELKQFEMSEELPEKNNPMIRYFIGDIRDYKRLRRAMEGIDYVIHTAALKQVPAAEYNPIEFIKTNIIGTQNIIEASMDNDVKGVVGLSTDKASGPINLYGATKLCSDKLFVAANKYKGSRDLTFSIVRYGNVMGSRGSVIPLFIRKAKEENSLPITDSRMTRFNISLDQGVDMVLWALLNAKCGEIFVPKIPSFHITELAKSIGPTCDIINIGIRPGEKIHEEMISESESIYTVDLGKYYAILPTSGKYTADEYCEKFNGETVKEGFTYNSGKNDKFLSSEELTKLIIANVDENFQPI